MELKEKISTGDAPIAGFETPIFKNHDLPIPILATNDSFFFDWKVATHSDKSW